ncbi:glycosyltransferase [Clostridium gasigenes]|uniref:glycosyltransferase family 4 protein n=1 Tax=Clostridium gasigenes TaxID=94869 RepID=UPI00162587DC|nr:glycosyltransferase [Clostridium gasigenes]MBB6624654.1 glycosyltransferase [Clostridium gasigenes]MBU3137162.1 glycosyltransferase [Clostridium gasigenes]
MRILVTVDTYAPKYDGVQNITQKHIEELQKKGHQIIVITQLFDNMSEYEVINGVHVYRYKLFTKLGIHFGDIKGYVKKVEQITKSVDIMLNICTQSATTDLLLKNIENFKCKKVLYLHGMYNFKYNKQDLKSFKAILIKIWFNLRWRIFYITNKDKLSRYDKVININYLDSATNFFSSKYNYNVEIINNFVEDMFFNEEKNNFDKKNQIVSVSNFSKLKNQKLLLKAFFELDVEKELVLILIGSEKNNYLEELIKEYEFLKNKNPLLKVEFITGISRKNISKIINESLIFILGSEVEKVPVVILEAMASGIPFISTDVGCIRYLPGGFATNNLKEFTYYLQLLLEHNNVGKCLGEVGAQYATENLKLNKLNNKLENILSDLI